FSFSIAHGPPMSASGWPPPRTTLPIRIIVTGAASSPSTEGGLPEVRGGSVVARPAWSPSTVGGLLEVRPGSASPDRVLAGAARRDSVTPGPGSGDRLRRRGGVMRPHAPARPG